MKKSGEILTRTGSIRSRRSVVFVDDEIQEFSADLLENLSKVDGFSDENILRSVAKTLHDGGKQSRRIDALSLEIGPSNSADLTSEPGVTYRHSVCFTEDGLFLDHDENNSYDIVNDILEEIIDNVITSAKLKALDIYFFHPLAGKDDISRMTETFSLTRSSMVDHTLRLKAAMRIILVESARQIVVCYRRILLEQAERLRVGEDSRQVAMDTITRLMSVTEDVAELAVIYLKNATRDVIDTTVHDVKIVLGRMTEKKEVEPVAQICQFDEEGDIVSVRL